jgi:8-oxo-dGTP pyrophosphatase MutT (NUDIX family)
MTSWPPAVRRVAYGIFRALPASVRRRLVRSLTPNYTLGAVVLVRDPAGALLLLRQPSATGWSLPGGLLERHETPSQAAARELAEETGIRIDSGVLRPAQPNARVSTASQQVDMVFLLDLRDGDPALNLDPVEVAEAAWFTTSSLPGLTPPTARLLAAYGLGPGEPAQTDDRQKGAR